MNNHTLAIIHLKGWSDAAGSRPMNAVYADHPAGIEVMAAYASGYEQGQAARHAASVHAESIYHVRFGEITTA